MGKQDLKIKYKHKGDKEEIEKSYTVLADAYGMLVDLRNDTKVEYVYLFRNERKMSL